MDSIKKFISYAVTVVTLLSSVIASIYAVKAYNTTLEISFPEKNAHSWPAVIESMSEESNQFIDFLGDNLHKTVYINIILDSSVSVDEDDEFYDQDDAESLKSTPEDKNDKEESYFKKRSMTIWTDCADEHKEEDPLEWPMCTGVTIQFQKSGSDDADLYWYKGDYKLSGYFSVVGFSGPYQGMMDVVLRGENIK
ncbi:hypothetical protein [Morganella sp. GD04133]|uniref:hypothetical protein n=1 Tax=Morganella sp. GD04133 TaxID=2975435 RepID=UPI00244BB465|nr:hypothetical protein [Morganella sp. GD04133]MDH0355008.1 hypothetical protein [Morganella sp. GD04133]